VSDRIVIDIDKLIKIPDRLDDLLTVLFGHRVTEGDGVGKVDTACSRIFNLV
jgi:hypothetical protein